MFKLCVPSYHAHWRMRNISVGPFIEDQEDLGPGAGRKICLLQTLHYILLSMRYCGITLLCVNLRQMR
jgi:hypothetical protein